MRNLLFIMVIGLFMTVVPTFVWAAAAKAVITGTTPQSKVSGEVVLTEENNGLTVEAKLSNLSEGNHGFHIHENGKCDDAGKAAGGHFNPDGVMHGYMPKDGMTHAHPGDMGNLQVDAQGNATLKVFLPGVNLQQGKYGVLGRAIVVHEKEDDFSQPTGNAGGRVGCGVIQAVDVEK